MLQKLQRWFYGGNVDIVSAQLFSVRKKDMEDAEIGDNIVANGVIIGRCHQAEQRRYN